MSDQVTIVMYHYVRDLARSRYPEIKGLDLALFREQLRFIDRHCTFVTMEQVLDTFTDPAAVLPPNAVLLTFDDGYADHFTNVFPILDDMGVQGSFFPPAVTVRQHRVLGVNKIHFILASAPDRHALIQHIETAMERDRVEFGLDATSSYKGRLATATRFDTKEVAYIKRLLQAELPEPLRDRITDELFTRHVSGDEAAFAQELYVSEDQLQCMLRHGMFIGGHGDQHYWMDRLGPEEQAREVDGCLAFLSDLGCDMSRSVIAYPYGAWNEPLLDLLRDRGVRGAVTTAVEVATDLRRRDPLLLPRLDTNDLPKDAEAGRPSWASA